MSFSRLYRLLKPALLCGALAAPGLASTMVSAAPPAGQWAVGRARDLPSGDLGRGAPAAPSAAIRTGARALAGVTVRVWVRDRGGVRGAGDRAGRSEPKVGSPQRAQAALSGQLGVAPSASGSPTAAWRVGAA